MQNIRQELSPESVSSSSGPPQPGWWGATFLMPHSITQHWQPRIQQIFPAEAIAVPIALAVLSCYLRDHDVVTFCDNESAVAALIRGASRSEDVSEIAELFTACCVVVGCRCWVDWIDSASNPSDGLSRDGIKDEWTARQNWAVSELQPLHFPEIASDPWSSAVLLVHWGLNSSVSA